MSEAINRARKIARLIRALDDTMMEDGHRLSNENLATIVKHLDNRQWEMVAKVAGYRDGHVGTDTRLDVYAVLSSMEAR